MADMVHWRDQHYSDLKGFAASNETIQALLKAGVLKPEAGEVYHGVRFATDPEVPYGHVWALLERT